jgi:UDP-N-acetylmuramoylalanine--D-glutamate ligase
VSSRPGLPPGPYLVVGLARSGAAIARVLAEHGQVIGSDAGAPGEASALDGIEVHLHSDGLDLLDLPRTVGRSRGAPGPAAVVAAARARGLEITGEFELAWRLLPNRFLAVTGTNGKTTTVELLGEMYRAAGLPVAVAGNVGTPLASLVGAIDPDATVVCEASSFQLEDSSAFAPECAVLLNLQEDHLDRHGDLEHYRAAKLKIFANQEAGQVAIDPDVTAAHTAVESGVLSVRGKVLLPLPEIRLRGAHNLENVRAAALAATDMEVPAEGIRQALRDFAGVAHRLEEVATVDGVLYVNDSKATNVASAVKAIESFDGGVHAILGGSLKGGGFTGLRDALSAHARTAYLIGEAQERLADDLEGTVPLRRCATLEEAVHQAAQAARSGEVVLLSPACASFDAFENYEHRGDRFRTLAKALG